MLPWKGSDIFRPRDHHETLHQRDRTGLGGGRRTRRAGNALSDLPDDRALPRSSKVSDVTIVAMSLRTPRPRVLAFAASRRRCASVNRRRPGPSCSRRTRFSSWSSSGFDSRRGLGQATSNRVPHLDPRRSGIHCSFPPICTIKPSGSSIMKLGSSPKRRFSALGSVVRTFSPRRFSSASIAPLSFLSVSQLARVYAM
jgi:hypothetical protein